MKSPLHLVCVLVSSAVFCIAHGTSAPAGTSTEQARQTAEKKTAAVAEKGQLRAPDSAPIKAPVGAPPPTRDPEGPLPPRAGVQPRSQETPSNGKRYVVGPLDVPSV